MNIIQRKALQTKIDELLERIKHQAKVSARDIEVIVEVERKRFYEKMRWDHK